MTHPLTRLVTAIAVPFLLLTDITAQCKECGSPSTEQREKKSKKPRPDELPRTGHEKLSSGRVRGSLVQFRHSQTSRELLRLDWHYAHPAATKSLTRKAALAFLNGKTNHKPLLVVRGCLKCGTASHPVLDRSGNDELRLLCRWFHLVKVPAEVARPGHALHALFEGDAEHAFACHWTGADRVDLPHNTTSGTVKKTLLAFVAASHEESPKPALRSLAGMLARLDKIDEAKRDADRQFERESTRSKPRRSKISKLRATIKKIEVRRKSALERVTKLSDLGLLPIPKTKR